MPKPVHRDHARKFVVGVIVLVVAGTIGLVGATVQGGGELPAKPYTYVTAGFRDVGMLKPQNPVQEHGRRIGTVSSIDYKNGLAVVTIRLDGDRAVYGNANASVHNASALGRKFVELDPGGPQAGPLGDRMIPPERTGASVALDDVFSVFDPNTRQALSSSLRELGGGLVGHSDDLRSVVRASPDMLDNLGQISGALSSPQAGLPDLLGSANRLAGRFQGREQELSGLLERLDTTFQAVNVDGTQPLGQTLRDLPPTLREAQRGLAALNPPLADVRSAVETIRPGGQALGASANDLRSVLREAVPPLDKVPGLSERATPAVEDLTHTFADARPLVPRLSRTVRSADLLLQGLAPYAPDIGRFVSEHDLLSGAITPDQHYFSAMVTLPGIYTAGLPDPTVQRVPYPAPGGGAWRDSAGTGGGNR